MRHIYEFFRFLFEILTVIVIGYWGATREVSSVFKLALSLAGPIFIVVIWSRWGAPLSSHSLEKVEKLVFELFIYFVAAVCLYFTNLKNLTLFYFLIGIINAIINCITSKNN